MMSWLPSLSQAYMLLIQEQQYQELSVLSNKSAEEGMTFVSNRRRSYERCQTRFVNKPRLQKLGGSGVDNNVKRNVLGVKRQHTYYCTHCKMNGHNLERCWKIHDSPPGFKNYT